MRAVLQRVSRAEVRVAGESVGRIGAGLVVLLGVGREDGAREVEVLADKVVGLRIFDDAQGKMNCSVLDVGGEVLIVSQFTLWGDCRRGRRPSFDRAAGAEQAEALYRQFIAAVERRGPRTAAGRFQATMQVDLVNDGPVTLLLDTSGTV
jgi:D-tyrosyl-tRNA(Tyr) deacylase